MRQGSSWFAQKGRAIDGLPPTQAALVQHIKRAAYQAAQVMIALQSFHHQENGGGTRRLKEAGRCAGQLYLKPHKLVGN